MERASHLQFQLIQKSIQAGQHNEVATLSQTLLSNSPEDLEAKLCLVVAHLKTENVKQLQATLFKNPPGAKEHEELHLYYAYFLYLQGDYPKTIRYVKELKQTTKAKLLLAQALYKNLEYEQSVQLMVELINEQRKDRAASADDMIVNLLAACEGSENVRLRKLLDEMRIGKTEHQEMLFNLALLFRETGDPAQARRNLQLFVSKLQQPQDHQDLIAAKLLRDYIDSFDESLEGLEGKISEYEEYLEQEFRDKNIVIVVDNNLTALRELTSQPHYEHLKKYEDYIGGKYKQTRQQLKVLRLSRLIMLLKKNRIHDASKALKDLEGSIPAEELLQDSRYLKCKAYLLEKLKEEKELDRLIEDVKDPFVKFFIKAEHLRSQHNMAEIVAEHRRLSKQKDFSENEVLNKYIFSVLLKDQDLFDREVEGLYNMINTTSDLTVLRILREIFGKKGQVDRETQILQKILKLNPKDQSARLQLAKVSLQSGNVDRCEELMKGLNKPDEITDMNLLQTLENNIHFSITKKDQQREQVVKLKKKIKKRRKRYPKGFDPANPGPPPNPERWIPKFDRKDFKKKKNFKSGRTQGATNVGKESLNTYTTSNTTSNIEVTRGKARKHRR